MNGHCPTQHQHLCPCPANRCPEEMGISLRIPSEQISSTHWNIIRLHRTTLFGIHGCLDTNLTSNRCRKTRCWRNLAEESMAEATLLLPSPLSVSQLVTESLHSAVATMMGNTTTPSSPPCQHNAPVSLAAFTSYRPRTWNPTCTHLTMTRLYEPNFVCAMCHRAGQ